jgi:hypothetical protein
VKVEMTGGQLKAAMGGAKMAKDAVDGAKKVKKNAVGKQGKSVTRLCEDVQLHRKYTKMFYKNNNSFAIRVSGGPQILSICDKRLKKPALERLCTQAMNTLNFHERSEMDVHAMVMHKLGK